MLKLSSSVILILITSTASLLVFFSADPIGYCASEDRIISDSEFQRATFNVLKMQRQLVFSIQELGGATRHNVKLYDERYSKWAETFNAKNCCDVEKNVSFFRRVLKFQEVIVKVYPQAPLRSDDELTFNYDVCGNLKASDVGVPSTEIHDVKTTNKELQDGSILFNSTQLNMQPVTGFYLYGQLDEAY